MILDQIRQKYRGEFQPFVVRTTDGREFKAPRIGCVGVGKDSISAVDRRGAIVFIDAAKIASVKDLPVRRRRKRAA